MVGASEAAVRRCGTWVALLGRHWKVCGVSEARRWCGVTERRGLHTLEIVVVCR